MYWDDLQRRLVSRRRLLAATGAVALAGGAVGLVGCGGDEEEKGGGTATAGAAAGEPKRGGHIQTSTTSANPLDPVLSSAYGTYTAIGAVYSRLWQQKVGAGLDSWDWTLEPDLALSLEQPDKTTYVYKLRQGVKWQNVPPMNGRAFTAEDVVYSFRRALDLPASALRGEFASIISSVRAIDPATVEIKTSEPYSFFNARMGGAFTFWMIPRELVEQKGDLKEVAIGTGPFLLENYQPSVSLAYARNPNYYGSPKPYVDKFTLIYITDASAAEAAFTTGKTDTHGVQDRRTFDRMKAAVPDAQTNVSDSVGHYFYFRSDRPPFQDVRMRQAFALTIDYQGLIQAFTSGDGHIDTLIPQAMKAWSVPPSQWGEGAKYHSKPDIAEAKKLMEAAGYGGGVEFNFFGSSVFAGIRQSSSFIQAMAQGAEKAGFRAKLQFDEYAVYILRAQGKSEYNGMMHLPAAQLQDPDNYIYTYLYPGAPRDASFNGDKELHAMIIKQRQEFDTAARKRIITDIERRNLVQNYYMPTISFNAYTLWQKRLQNYSPRPDPAPIWAAAAWLQA